MFVNAALLAAFFLFREIAFYIMISEDGLRVINSSKEQPFCLRNL